MAAIDFPSSPTVGQQVTVDNRSWTWDGSVWEAVVAGTGPQGPAGPTGATGPAGANGSFSTAQVIETKSANYTLTSADAGKLILNSNDVTITVQGLAVGTQVDFLQMVTNRITFVAGSGITLASKSGNLKTAGQYSPATVKCLTSTSYVLVGDLGA